MSQVQSQPCAAGQVELTDERKAGHFVPGLARFGSERFPMWKIYLSHTSPLTVGNGECRQRRICSSLRQ